jgi:hypothetical protein
MISLLAAFFISFFTSILIIRTQKLHGELSGDHDLGGPQKFHIGSVPRVGGVAIGLGIFVAIALRYEENMSNFSNMYHSNVCMYCDTCSVKDASAARLNNGMWEGTGHVMWIEDGLLDRIPPTYTYIHNII